MEIEIDVHNVKLGMFVARLDRPWLGTPFPFEGFWVRNMAAIDQLRLHCRSVWVRTDQRGRPSAAVEPDAAQWSDRTTRTEREPRRFDFQPARPVAHEDSTSVDAELAPAQFARRNLCVALDEVVTDIRRDRRIAVSGLKEAVNGLTESVLRNPDACMWLRLVKDRDSYTYYHLLDTSALAVALGRHLGFSRAELADIGLGALLIDIGKLKLPEALLAKTGALSDHELSAVKRHVEYGVELVKDAGVSPRVLEIIASHHERFDGRGYPGRLHSRAIPPFARMVAVADFFDAVTSDRAYAAGISPHDAMRRLYDEAGHAFQREIVEQFIQCIGIYPTGTLVKLTTGEIGIVVGQNRVRRLKPRLMLIFDATGEALDPFLDLDLATSPDDGSVAIKRSIEPEQLGIDPRQFYLSSKRISPELLRRLTERA
jgi:putative nucleotidyltransferase with HDIG domain